MMLEHTLQLGADNHRLHWIAQQVAYHSHITGMRYFHKHSHVGTVLPKRRVGGMPDTLPTEDAPMWLDFSPFRIKGVATMADPLRPELPCTAMAAALNQETVLAQPRPVRR